MKFKIEAPKENPKISVEAELSEEQIKTGLARLYKFVKDKLPIKLQIGKKGNGPTDS